MATKKKSTSTRTKSSAKSKKKQVPNWKEHLLLRDHRTRKITGGILCLVAVFMVLSFVSFLFTWKSDSSFFYAVQDANNYFDQNPDAIRNWMKKGGATLSFIFIYQGFGLAAFAIPVFIAILGLRVYTGFKVFNVYAALKYSLIVLVFLSVLLATIFYTSYPVLGGVFGHNIFVWLRSMIGTIGVALLLLFALTFLPISGKRVRL